MSWVSATVVIVHLGQFCRFLAFLIDNQGFWKVRKRPANPPWPFISSHTIEGKVLSLRSMNIETNINTPILFLIFSRQDTTRREFEAIRAAHPRQVFIAADGPRPHKEGEAERCEECRKIASEVDWPCEVHTLFREENLGCGRAVSGAITWFFEHVEEGIILEDDTLPGPGFFRFCSELLERYRHDTRVMAVSGS